MRAPVSGKAVHLLYALFHLFAGNLNTYDIVITEPSVLGISGFFYRLFGKAKWVVDIWDIPIRCNLNRGLLVRLRCSLLRFILKHLYRSADLFIVSILPDFELQYFRLPPGKMLLLRNAICSEKLKGDKSCSSRQDTFNLLCMRSVYTEDMGLDTLARAFVILNDQIPNLSLTIVGNIPDKINSQIDNIRAMLNVTFLDSVGHEALKELICASSVCVVPFRDVPDLAQTYPVKVLEYMALGKAVVASDIAGISQMLTHKTNGLLFRAGDPQDLASKVLQLYEDCDLLGGISERAKAMDSSYDCREKNRKIIDSLSLVLDGKQCN